jgi:hypothetical protein
MLIRTALNGAVHFAGGVALGALGVLAAKSAMDTARRPSDAADPPAPAPHADAFPGEPPEPRPAPD